MQKQKLLERKFHASKSKANIANVGGGISIWPEMENMRLTPTEVWLLVAVCIGLVAVVYMTFQAFHGECYTAIRLVTLYFKYMMDT